MNYITVYTGPMFCGKSDSLITAYEKSIIAGKQVLAFKPKQDTRTDGTIKSRNGGEIPAISIEKIEELKRYDTEVYIVDEFQFLNGDPMVIQEMACQGKIFYIAGLNMTSEGKPFGHMPELLAIAEKRISLTAICSKCKEDNATYSFYLGNDKDGKTVLVGDKNYIPLCTEDWSKAMAERENKF